MRILVLDNVPPVLAERLGAAGHECIDLYHNGVHEKDKIKGELATAEGLIVRSRVVDGDLLTEAPKLRFVGRLGAGLENIDLAYCAGHGILLFNSPEGNRDGVGETTMLLLLMLLKKAASAVNATRHGAWPREEHRGLELHGRTVGLIGFGHMGSAFAERLQGFGARILAHDKYRSGHAPSYVKEVGLEELQNESEVVSLHLPLTDETRHYVNDAFIARMARPFWLMNTARGGVVDTRALLDGLDEERVLGAGLDVLEYERPDLAGLDESKDPRTLDRLRQHPRVVITPHIAGVTHEGALKMAEVLAGKILNDFPHGT